MGSEHKQHKFNILGSVSIRQGLEQVKDNSFEFAENARHI
jgi:hypothetical protein